MLSRTTASKCPCLDCQTRRPGCHGKCRLYQDWEAQAEAERAEQLKRSILRDALWAYEISADRKCGVVYAR